MNPPLDSFRQLDERAIIGEAHYLAANPGADREPLLDALPGVLRPLFVAQGDPLRGSIKLQDHDFDLIANDEKLRRVTDATPGHVGNMKETVQPAEAAEGAVLGDIFDLASDNLHLL